MEQNPIREQLSPTRALNYQSLDAWRGLACLAVVFYHCWLELSLRLKTMPKVFGWAQYGNLGVQVFFVVSGFCIAVAAHSSWNKRTPGKFVWARLTRIFPPLWGALLLVILLKLVARHGGASGEEALQGSANSGGALFYAANFSLLNPILRQPFLLRVAWSLCYEVAFYALVFGALVGFARAKSANAMLNALHALSLGILAWLLVPFSILPPPRFPFDLWPQFGAGVLVFDCLLARAQNEGKRGRFLRMIGLAFATLGVAFLARCARTDIPALREHLAPFAVSFGFAAILWGAYRFEDIVNSWRIVQWLRFLGTFSYSIYLVHFSLIMALSRGLFSRVKGIPWFVEVVLLVLVSLASGWAFYEMVEKPSQKLKRFAK